MDQVHERTLGLAERVLRLRAAAESPEAAMGYVRKLLDEAEAAFAAGKTTTRQEGPAAPPPPKRAATSTKVSAAKGDPKGNGHNGRSAKARTLFKDGKVHTSEGLRTQLGADATQVKKTIANLKGGHWIKRVGEKGSGRYQATRKLLSSKR